MRHHITSSITPPSPTTTVLKLGGSVLRTEDDLNDAVHEIYRWIRRGRRVVAVVSAFEGTTDALLSRARRVSENGNDDAVAMLLATGEFTTAALLSMALSRAGIRSKVLGPHALNLRTRGSGADADPASIDRAALRGALEQVPVVVIPGFVGIGIDQGLTLLGRGGSDLTALFVAAELGAHCRLIKDVDGLYERDPALPGPPPRRFRSLSWQDALCLDGGIVQHKAVRLAQQRSLRFEVGAFQREDVSLVGETTGGWHDQPSRDVEPLRVALLGCGAVGGGVLAHLQRLDRCFEVTGVLVRDSPLRRHACGAAPLTTDPTHVADRAQVVVEMLGGIEPAASILGRELSAGHHVVTANKALIAEHHSALMSACSAGATLTYSAAVGGAVPMIELIDRIASDAGVESFEGVLNGTSNFILEFLRSHADIRLAIREAQNRGFAEADPGRDLDGSDALEKLRILARHAFGTDAELGVYTRVGLIGPESELLHNALEAGTTLRLIAWARRTPSGIRGGVGPVRVPVDHPLYILPDAQNRLVVRDASGASHTIDGSGAGRWPTSESVLADLFDLWRADRAAVPGEARIRREVSSHAN